METAYYIWQRNDWPAFTWDDEKIFPLLYETSRKEAGFLGKVSMLSDDIKKTAAVSAFEDEIISSNSIENIMLKRDSVRSSILSRLGLDDEGLGKTDRYTEGAVNIVIDAVENREAKLTKERLFGWHTELFPAGFSEGRRITTGMWRQGGMYVISGNTGKEIIHYEAPPAERIETEMDRFLKFINENETVNPIIKAAIAHLWFVSIHPFADGNGRIARTITEMLLSRADDSAHRYYSLSAAIMKSRKECYDILEYSQKSTMDITSFIEYFLKTMQNAILNYDEEIRKAIEKTRFWDAIRLIPLNEREVKLINRLFDGFEGKLTTEKWAKIAKCSHSTALRDINDLINKGILIEDGGNSRNTGYMLNMESKEL